MARNRWYLINNSEKDTLTTVKCNFCHRIVWVMRIYCRLFVYNIGRQPVFNKFDSVAFY